MCYKDSYGTCYITVHLLAVVQRPGAVAAALPPSAPTTPKPTPLWDVPVHWSLSDVIDGIHREVQRRESQYPIQMQQGLLSAEQAQQELGQMKAALSLLTSRRERGQEARQGMLFEVGNSPTESRATLRADAPAAPPGR